MWRLPFISASWVCCTGADSDSKLGSAMPGPSVTWADTADEGSAAASEATRGTDAAGSDNTGLVRNGSIAGWPGDAGSMPAGSAWTPRDQLADHWGAPSSLAADAEVVRLTPAAIMQVSTQSTARPRVTRCRLDSTPDPPAD